MNLQLNFLLPNLRAANQIFDALLLSRVSGRNIAFLANKSIKLGRLKPVGRIAGSELLCEGGHGILYGAIFGLISGLYVLYFPLWVTSSPAWYTVSAWWVILIITTSISAISVGLGAAILGGSILSRDLKLFKNKIEDGSILMIVSAPSWQEKSVRLTVSRLH